MSDLLRNVVAILMAIIGIAVLALLLNNSGAAGNLIQTSSSSFGNLLQQASAAGGGGGSLGNFGATGLSGVPSFSGG